MTKMGCKNCNHSLYHHLTKKGRRGGCKFKSWDEKQELYMPCKCKEFRKRDKI